jgi:hypothetical protein
MTWVWVILTIIVVLYLLKRLFIYLLAYAFYNATRPNTVEESVYRMTNILNYKIIMEYEVLEHESKNYHGDKPLYLSLLLSEKSFYDLMQFISTKSNEVKEKMEEDNTTKHIFRIEKKDNSYCVSHNVELGDYPTYSSGLVLEYDTRKLHYSEIHY